MKGMLIAVIALNFMFFSCEKQTDGPRIKGKLVHSSCASKVVQILDANYYSLGQQNWQQSANTPVFNNVFAVDNLCTFNTTGIKEGDEFYFELTTVSNNGCAICAMLDNPPTVKQKIEVIK